jgi:hypothetical protein
VPEDQEHRKLKGLETELDLVCPRKLIGSLTDSSFINGKAKKSVE